MISDADRERITKLPTWARDLIKRLERAAEPAVEQARKATRDANIQRVKCAELRDANSALIELLSVAGRNGIDWAKKIVEVLEGYCIFKEDTTEEQT